MGMMKDLEGLSERCGGKQVLAADFRNWCRAERNSQRKPSLKLQRGILKIEEADDGALSIRMMRI
jgi:hypothetical protein